MSFSSRRDPLRILLPFLAGAPPEVGLGLPGVPLSLRGLPLGDLLAVVAHGAPLGAPHDRLRAVPDDQDGDPLGATPGYEPHQAALLGGIHARRRFVEAQ